MAVPGSILGSRHRGCHALLRDGARLVETAGDVLEELGLTALDTGRPPGATPEHDRLLALLATEGDGDLDLLSERSGLPVSLLLPRLLALELAGLVRRAPGGRFVRAGG
jgi:DNA processing protein